MISVWCFLIFLISLLKFLLCSCTALLTSVDVFYDHCLNCLSGKLLISISSGLFSGDLSCSFFFGTYSPVSSFSLTLCVGFSTLDKTVTSVLPSVRPHVGDEHQQSALLELLAASHTVVIVHAAVLVLSGSQQLRVCHGHPCPKGEDHSQHLEAGWLEARPSGCSWESVQWNYF